METFYVWVREGDFWNRKEVSQEEYMSLASDSKNHSPARNNYEYHGPMIARGDGTKHREQRLK